MTEKKSKKFTFRRGERLKRRTTIGRLFREGKSFVAYPLRFVYLTEANPAGYPTRIAVSVPKKRFKKATDRNPIRRQIKEAWRLEKPFFYEQLPDEHPGLAIMIIYVGKEIPSLVQMQKAIQKGTKRLLKAIQPT